LINSVPSTVPKDSALSNATTRAIQNSKVASKLLSTRPYQSFTTEELRGNLSKMLFLNGKHKDCVVPRKTLFNYIKQLKAGLNFNGNSKSEWLEFCEVNKINIQNEIDNLEIKSPGYERYLNQPERDVAASVLDIENQHNTGYSKSEVKELIQRTIHAKAQENIQLLI
jgi:hypothetical protein